MGHGRLGNHLFQIIFLGFFLDKCFFSHCFKTNLVTAP